MTAYARITDALRAHGSTVRTSGGRTMAQCPAHKDRNPSLSVTGIEGSVLLHCHAGCDPDAVLDVLKLSKADLYDEPKGATYNYSDPFGTITRTVHRTPDKHFRQSGDTKGTATLYRLPKVIAAVKAGRTVHLVEGEKDVHAVEKAGGVACTAPMGSSNIGRCDLSPLHGAHVIAVVDRDDAGDKWATKARDALDGQAASLAFVHAATGKDTADHIAAGHTLDQLVPIDAEPKWSDYLDVVNAADVTLRRVRYLWDRRIPLGAMTLMPGEEGIGKTTVNVRLIAEMTLGALPGEFYGTPRDAIVIATEDGLEDVFVPRLREAGADLSRVHIIRASIGLDGDKRAVIVPRDLARIGLLVREHNAAMVYIDSLVTTLPDELKSISYKDTAKVLKALGTWAEAERVAVVAPWHLNKTSGADTALRIMDSRAFRTAVRSMLLVVPDPDAPEGVTQGLVALDKANAGTLNVPGLRYRIRSAAYTVAEVDESTGEVTDMAASCSVVDWIGEVDGDGRQIARDALAPAIEREGSPKTWLRDYLRAEGEVSRADVIAAGGEDGFGLDQIKRAARGLGVHSREETGRDEKTGRPWRSAIWSLPQSGGKSVHSHPTAPTAPTGETYQRPTTTTCAGQGKSVQSVQSVMDGENRPTGDQTAPLEGDPAQRCPCGRWLAPGRALDGHTRCTYCVEDKEKSCP